MYVECSSMLQFILTAFVVVVTTVMFIYLSWSAWISKYSFLPTPPGVVPWIGTTLTFSDIPHVLFSQIKEWSQKYNYLFILWFGPIPMIMTGRVEYVEAVLSSQTLIKKSTLYHFLHEWLGMGLLTSYGQKWKSRRRMITPTFHFAILKEFVDMFEEQALILVEKFRLAAVTGKAIDVQPPVSLAKLDVICDTSMGVNVNAQGSSSAYVEAVHAMTSFLQERQKYPWFWPKFIYSLTASGKAYYKSLATLQNFTIDVINKRIEKRKQGKLGSEEGTRTKKKRVFLDMILDSYDQGDIDIEGIREEVDTFMFEGHDTTSTGLAWTLHLLGRHPEIQERLHEELKKIDADLPLIEQVKSSKYLECVLKEALRLHPPVPLMGRVVEEDITIDNNFIPKGSEIGLFVYALHRNPAYWDDPDQFNPDRFAEDNYVKRNPYCYIPFSAGARNCIGQKFAMLEEKVFLYHLVLNLKFKSTQAPEDIHECFEIIHKSENGLFVEMTCR